MDKKEIGKRITQMRKLNNLSQIELAEAIGLSRSSYTQVELGNRNLDVTELYAIAQVLHFSIDEFLAPDFKVETTLENEKEEKQAEIRVSVPQLDIEKFKNTLLYVLENCAGKPNVGETVLNKLLYFCDFNYYEIYEEQLTGATYKKLQFGPVPQKMSTILNTMVENKELQEIKTEYYGKKQRRWIPLKNASLKSLNAAEKDVIDKVIQQMGDWNAHEISTYSHKDIPWVATKEGKVIKYNLAFYREAPYAVRKYDEE